MNDDVITKVLALFDLEDIPFIKARRYVEYERNKKKSYVKKIGDFNGHTRTKVGRIFLSRN